MTDQFTNPEATPFPDGTIPIYPKALDGYFFAASAGKLGIALVVDDKAIGHFAIVLAAQHVVELHDFTSRILSLSEHDMQAYCAQVHSLNPEDRE